jgi:hypothetical protein
MFWVIDLYRNPLVHRHLKASDSSAQLSSYDYLTAMTGSFGVKVLSVDGIEPKNSSHGFCPLRGGN